MLNRLQSLPARQLTVLYISALGLVGLLVWMGYSFATARINEQANDARLINLAGRQRGLSQRLCKAALDLKVHPDAATRATRLRELGEVTTQWATERRILGESDESSGFPGIITPDILKDLRSLEPRFAAMSQAAGKIRLAAAIVPPSPGSEAQVDAGIQTLLDQEAGFLNGMDQIVSRIERESLERVNRLRMIEDGFLAATLLALFFEGVFIFRPGINRVGAVLAKLAERTLELSRLNESLRLEVEEKERAERTARRAEEKYRDIFEHALEGIYQSTPEGFYLNVNPALARMYGYPSGEEMFASIRDIQTQIYVDPAARALFQEMIRARGTVRDLEYQVRRRDGSAIWISETARAVKDPAGKVLYYEGTVQDITERKLAAEEKARLESQLRQSQKMEAIGALAGGIAHDFNNILGAIIGFNELVADDVPPGSVARNNLDEALKAAHRARELVRQILAFSRGGETESQPTPVGPVVAEALRLMRASLPSSLEIKVEIKSKRDLVLTSPVQVHQILMNLCSNAAHAMRGAAGVIRVVLDEAVVGTPELERGAGLKPGAYVRLSVEDTGCGMEPDVVERIFEPFYTTKPVGEGTGLGLSVVHGIVKKHGGGVKVASQPGRGTVFQVFLPQADGLEPALLDALPAPRGGEERVLLVDDEPVLLVMMEQKLRRLGYLVDTASTAGRALEIFGGAPGRFDLVITDQTMPQMTGLELAAELRRTRPDLPVILCTGYARDFTAEDAGRLGVSDIISKPVNSDALCAAIRRILDRSVVV